MSNDETRMLRLLLAIAKSTKEAKVLIDTPAVSVLYSLKAARQLLDNIGDDLETAITLAKLACEDAPADQHVTNR